MKATDLLISTDTHLRYRQITPNGSVVSPDAALRDYLLSIFLVTQPIGSGHNHREQIMKIRGNYAKYVCIPLLGFTMFVGTAVSAHADDLLSVLQKRYVPTQTTFDRSQLTSIGTVLTVQVAGINSEPWGTIINLDNKVADGKVQPGSHWGQLVKTTNMYVLQPF